MKAFSLESLAALAEEKLPTQPAPEQQPETPVDHTFNHQSEPSIIYLEMSVDQLFPFPNQPFKPHKGEKYSALCESIKSNGVFTPLTVRPFEDGYQIISGHNRARAAKEVGLVKVPTVIKQLDDDAAWIELIETNLNQREDLLPSEKAYAYKLRMEALNRQGLRLDLIFGTDVQKIDSAEEVSNESGRNVRRYIRLTYLLPPLLDLVDEQHLIFVAAVEISYLSHPEQQAVLDFFFSSHTHLKLDLNTAKTIRDLSNTNEITHSLLAETFVHKAAAPKKDIKIKISKLKKIIPSTYDNTNLEQLIIDLLTQHFKTNSEV